MKYGVIVQLRGADCEQTIQHADSASARIAFGWARELDKVQSARIFARDSDGNEMTLERFAH